MKNIYKYIVLLGLMTLSGSAYCQTSGMNYILSRTYKQTGAAANNVGLVNIDIQYMDSLGRPKQNIQVARSTSGADIVQNTVYDQYGRSSRRLLPHVYNGGGGYRNPDLAGNDNSVFYSTNGPQIEASDLARPYTDYTFDLSPSDRILGVRAPGNKSLSDNFVYGTNTASEVLNYKYTANSDITQTIAASPALYPAGVLKRIQTTDENGKLSVDYIDKQERLICRKLSGATASEYLGTNYVYDDYGQLRAVLQPQYSVDPNAANYAFLYEYDIRGRVCVKKTPGAAPVNMAYDNVNRLALYQDGNLLAQGVWGFIKYDGLNRPVMYGYLTSANTRTTWQTALNANMVYYEKKVTTGIGYTLSNTLPTITEPNVYRAIYYDDYSFPKPTNLEYSNVFSIAQNTSVRSMETGSRVRMLPGVGAPGGLLVSAVYYDAEYRPIQTTRQLYNLGTDAIERVSTKYKYDLAPVVDQQKTEHLLPSSVTNTVLKTYLYDHADRLLSVKETVTIAGVTKEATTLAQRYNPLGELKQKWLHSTNSTHFRRRTDYTNNIRGWRTNINTKYLTAASVEAPFLTMGQFYGTTNYTNGNLSSIQWGRKDAASYTAGVSFTYDGANRLTASSGLNGNTHLETGISYDRNGNILKLRRAGAVVDSLTYTNTGNRVSSINDISGNNLGMKAGVSSYGYDTNGNITSDGNRGAAITYNYMNMPKTVIIGAKTKIYDYDAAGTKRKYYDQVVADTVNLKYEGAFEYKQDDAGVNYFNRLSLSEGQAVYRNNVLKFEYYLNDYLGNSRVLFDESGGILQQTDYYSFGLSIDKSNPAIAQSKINAFNRYTFLGRETQVGTGYMDLKRRFYDPLTGRFMGIDPLADNPKQLSMSPYSYSANNPIRFIDPTGMIWGDPKDAERLNKSINSRIESTEKSSSKIQAQIGKGGLSDKKLAKLEGKLADNSQKIELLNQSLADVESIGNAAETYKLTGPSASDGTHGVIKGADGVINIEGSNTGLHVHEIRHVGQSIEAGGVKFNKDGKLLNSATTLGGARNNEVNAYQTQYSFDGSYPAGANSLKDINGETLMNIKTSDGRTVYEKLKDKK